MQRRSKAIIFLDGFYDRRYPEFYANALQPGTFTVCADGAIRIWHWLREILGEPVHPDTAVGDFDSLSEQELWFWQNEGVHFDMTWKGDPEKPYTDGQLALQAALAAGCDHITIFGSYAASEFFEPDHFLGNLYLLAEGYAKTASHSFHISIQNPCSAIYLCHSEICLQRQGDGINRISLLPFQGTAKIKSTEGLRWPLNDFTLHAVQLNALRNEIMAHYSYAKIKLEENSAPITIVHSWR